MFGGYRFHCGGGKELVITLFEFKVCRYGELERGWWVRLVNIATHIPMPTYASGASILVHPVETVGPDDSFCGAACALSSAALPLLPRRVVRPLAVLPLHLEPFGDALVLLLLVVIRRDTTAAVVVVVHVLAHEQL